MYKKKVTNVSASSSKGARPIFLTETGKLLRPGDSCVLNRLNPGTQRYVTDGLLKVDDGSFERDPIFTEKQPTEPAKKKPVAVEVAPPVPQQPKEATPEQPPAAEPEQSAPEPAVASDSSDEAPAAAAEEGESSSEETTADEATQPTRRGRRRRS